MKKKTLLIYAHYYAPDVASTGQILQDLAEGMTDEFDVTIICVVPSYEGTIEEKYKQKKFYYEELNGVKIIRVPVPEFSKSSKKSRIKNLFAYYTQAKKAMTPTMHDSARGAGLTISQDKQGYYGYNSSYGAYVEVISYDKLLKDAKQRNKALFDKLFESKGELVHPELIGN